MTHEIGTIRSKLGGEAGLRVHARHRLARWGAAAAVGSALWVAEAPVAQACSPNDSLVYPLLPFEGQTGVPLNAALSVASSDSQIPVIELRVKGTGEPVEVTTDDCPGKICTATPGALAENTEYEYRGSIEHFDEESRWISFTTGDAELDSTLLASNIDRTVTTDRAIGACEGDDVRLAEITFEVASESLPLAIFEGSEGPHFLRPPLVLGAETSGLLRLTSAPDCVRPAAIDVLGSRVELSEICFSPLGSGPASGGASNSEEPIGGAAPEDDGSPAASGEKPSDSSGACSFQALSRRSGAGGWAWVLVAIAWAGGRRLCLWLRLRLR